MRSLTRSVEWTRRSAIYWGPDPRHSSLPILGQIRSPGTNSIRLSGKWREACSLKWRIRHLVSGGGSFDSCGRAKTPITSYKVNVSIRSINAIFCSRKTGLGHNTLAKEAHKRLYFLWEFERFSMSPNTIESLQVTNREHTDLLHHSSVTWMLRNEGDLQKVIDIVQS